VYFKSKEHQEFFKSLIMRTGQGNDVEYSAALYVLAAIGKEVSKYVLLGEIKFPALFRIANSKLGGKRAPLARVPFTTRILSNTNERNNVKYGQRCAVVAT
jgi:hypothetical protein